MRKLKKKQEREKVREESDNRSREERERKWREEIVRKIQIEAQEKGNDPIGRFCHVSLWFVLYSIKTVISRIYYIQST